MEVQRERILACLLLTLFIALLMLPNIVWLWQAPRETTYHWLVLAIALILTVGWFAFFDRALWLGCLVLSPLALLMPLELYYILHYSAPTSVVVFGTIAASSPAEASQFFGANLIPIAVMCGVSFVVAIFIAWRLRRSGLRWKGRMPRVMAWVLILGIPFPLFYGLAFPQKTESVSKLTRVEAAMAFETDSMRRWVEPGYPLGALLRVGWFYRYRYTKRAKVDRLADFHFDAALTTPLPQRQVYVLVIGESSQRGHWQLFGYDRPTNPELSKLHQLIPITQMVSAYAATIVALPVMLAAKPAKDKFADIWPQASIVRAMKEAGFATWWISNQYPVGPYDSAVAAYAQEADHVVWLNYADWQGRGHHFTDGDLLKPLHKALADSHQNVFIVLHMLGSHVRYDYRYPSSFRHFTPTLADIEGDQPKWQRVTNSYDNTILYSDWVLAQVIDTLKNSGAVTALWYASDHGETLPSADCDENQHGHGNRAEYQIPAFFWYSHAYAAAFPQRVATIMANANKRSMSENTFSSLIDMTGVDFPGHEKKDQWSLFSRNWHYHPRWVNHGSWQVNFDEAKPHGACASLQPEKE